MNEPTVYIVDDDPDMRDSLRWLMKTVRLHVETFASLLPGLGFGIDPKGRHNDGSFMLAIDPSAFMPLAEFKGQVEGFVKYLKETPPADGFKEVLYPGEKEYYTQQQRRAEGIPIEDSTWKRLTELAEKYDKTSLLKTRD